MKRFTYDISDGNNKLFYEEHYDNQDRIIYYKDHHALPPIEVFHTYDAEGRLTEEKQLEGGIEIFKTTFEFTADGEPLIELIYINGALYEKVIHEYSEGSHTRTRYEGGEEFEKMIRQEKGDNWTARFFVQGELSEIQTAEYNMANRKGVLKAVDGHGLFISLHHEYLDENGKTHCIETYNEFNVLEREEHFEYENGQTVKEIEKSHTDQEPGTETTYAYDQHGNLLRQQTQHLNGKLIEWQENTYNSNHQITEERGFAATNIQSAYIHYFMNRGFHFRHVYED